MPDFSHASPLAEMEGGMYVYESKWTENPVLNYVRPQHRGSPENIFHTSGKNATIHRSKRIIPSQ